MKKLLISAAFAVSISAGAQNDSSSLYINSVDNILKSNTRLGIGGYGEVHYNQPLARNTFQQGTLDVHRLVMFLGYNYSRKTQFVSEIEFEHAKELWVEQAFIQHKLFRNINLRAGLMLVPMGIINEYHEPVTFNGVERPAIDNIIVPTTWRETGTGFSGIILPLSIKYQAYVFGGLNGYDTKGVFTGSKVIREGRQKGSKAYFQSPAFAGRIEYFGIRNLNIGLSAYQGKSQSKLYNNLHKDSLVMRAAADSSVTGISLFGADVRYAGKGLTLRGQFYYSIHNNTQSYNIFTGNGNSANDLGKEITGMYAEIGYNVLRHFNKCEYEMIPFARYEYYNLHKAVESPVQKNPAYENTIITAGLSFKLNKGAVIKADIQFLKPESTGDWGKTINTGISILF